MKILYVIISFSKPTSNKFCLSMNIARENESNSSNWKAAKDCKIYKVKQGEYEKPNVKQSNNRRNSSENREKRVTGTSISAEERKEITTGIQKNKEKKV